MNSIIIENFRAYIYLRIKENKKEWDDKVTEIIPEETDEPNGGYDKIISSVTLD